MALGGFHKSRRLTPTDLTLIQDFANSPSPMADPELLLDFPKRGRGSEVMHLFMGFLNEQVLEVAWRQPKKRRLIVPRLAFDHAILDEGSRVPDWRARRNLFVLHKAIHLAGEGLNIFKEQTTGTGQLSRSNPSFLVMNASLGSDHALDDSTKL